MRRNIQHMWSKHDFHLYIDYNIEFSLSRYVSYFQLNVDSGWVIVFKQLNWCHSSNLKQDRHFKNPVFATNFLQVFNHKTVVFKWHFVQLLLNSEIWVLWDHFSCILRNKVQLEAKKDRMKQNIVENVNVFVAQNLKTIWNSTWYIF